MGPCPPPSSSHCCVQSPPSSSSSSSSSSSPSSSLSHCASRSFARLGSSLLSLASRNKALAQKILSSCVASPVRGSSRLPQKSKKYSERSASSAHGRPIFALSRNLLYRRGSNLVPRCTSPSAYRELKSPALSSRPLSRYGRVGDDGNVLTFQTFPKSARQSFESASRARKRATSGRGGGRSDGGRGRALWVEARRSEVCLVARCRF